VNTVFLDEGPRAAADLMDPGLRAAVGRIARTPNLLIACDYDGTLAPIVVDPGAVWSDAFPTRATGGGPMCGRGWWPPARSGRRTQRGE
jgi:hypothetical protein